MSLEEENGRGGLAPRSIVVITLAFSNSLFLFVCLMIEKRVVSKVKK